MSGALDRLRHWWRGHQPRERALLAVMAAMLAAFVWWYGLLGPLRALGDAAAAHYEHAASDLQAVEAALAALPRDVPAGGVAPSGHALQRWLLDSAGEAGLAPSRHRLTADGGVVVGFDRVPSAALFAWLGRLADASAMAPSSLRVERSDGQLRAEVGFGAGVVP